MFLNNSAFKLMVIMWWANLCRPGRPPSLPVNFLSRCLQQPASICIILNKQKRPLRKSAMSIILGEVGCFTTDTKSARGLTCGRIGSFHSEGNCLRPLESVWYGGQERTSCALKDSPVEKLSENFPFNNEVLKSKHFQ